MMDLLLNQDQDDIRRRSRLAKMARAEIQRGDTGSQNNSLSVMLLRRRDSRSPLSFH